MPTVSAYASYINFQNGGEYSWAMSSSVSSARINTMETLFAKDCFNIPVGSTINSVVLKFYGRQRRSNTDLYAMRWGLRNIRYLSNWDGVYSTLDAKINSGAVQKNTLYTSSARAHETEKMDDSYNSTPYSFTLSNYCALTRDQLMGGLWLELDRIFQGTLDSTIYIKDLKVEVDYTLPSYHLDVNGWINGAETGELRVGGASVGKIDVYINGSYVKTDDDYWELHPYGTKYEITNIKALPGWHYDDVHSGSLTGTLTQETKVILAFSRIKCRVLASASTGGSVDGGGTFDYGTSVTLTAKADVGYEFAYWSDNQSDTNPSRTFTVTSDVSLTAIFVKKKYVISTDLTKGGTVQGIGTYEHGAVVTLTAVPDDGYGFVSWDDGNTDPTRTIVVTSAAKYTAIFEAVQTKPVFTHAELIYGGQIVSSTNKALAGQVCILTVGAV